MEKRSSPFRLLLGPPLIAMGLAAVIAYWVADDTPSQPEPPTPEPAPTPAAAPPDPVKPAAPVAQPQPAPAAAPIPQPVAPSPTPAAPETPDAGPKEAMLKKLAEPNMREHAQLMVIESAKAALKNRDLPGLQRLRSTLRTEGIDQAIAANDLTAIDIGIECLAKAADAKQRAFEFLEDNPGSPIAESLRAACQ